MEVVEHSLLTFLSFLLQVGLVGVFGRERERVTRVSPFILGDFWDKSLLFSLNCVPGHASFVEDFSHLDHRKKALGINCRCEVRVTGGWAAGRVRRFSDFSIQVHMGYTCRVELQKFCCYGGIRIVDCFLGRGSMLPNSAGQARRDA